MVPYFNRPSTAHGPTLAEFILSPSASLQINSVLTLRASRYIGTRHYHLDSTKILYIRNESTLKSGPTWARTMDPLIMSQVL